MNKRIEYAAKYFGLLSVCIIFVSCAADAQATSHAQDVIIETSAALPVESRQPANAFYLNTNSGDGKAYLYIEQQSGKNLVVLDVTDLAHIKVVRSMDLSFSEPFRFAEELNNSYVVLRSINQKEMALLNTHKAKSPVLEAVDAFQHADHVQSIGSSTFLLASAHGAPSVSSTLQEYQVVESTKRTGFSILYSTKGVIASISRDETGTIFLLGSEGLTVIRTPEKEAEYEALQRYTN
jgi:hypothetical protein